MSVVTVVKLVTWGSVTLCQSSASTTSVEKRLHHPMLAHVEVVVATTTVVVLPSIVEVIVEVGTTMVLVVAGTG